MGPITQEEWAAWRKWCADRGVSEPCEELCQYEDGETTRTHYANWILRHRELRARYTPHPLPEHSNNTKDV